MMTHLEAVAPRIFRVPPVWEPLSSEAFIIKGDTRYYVYDVGASEAAFAAISALDMPVTAILSHFHRDHTDNMARLDVAETLVGARTRRQLGSGTLVEVPVTIRDGVEIVVQPCVSPHAPGCLIATVDSRVTLIGDLHYAVPGKGQGEARGMLNVLKRLRTQYFAASHMKGNPLAAREDMLENIMVHFGMK